MRIKTLFQLLTGALLLALAAGAQNQSLADL